MTKSRYELASTGMNGSVVSGWKLHIVDRETIDDSALCGLVPAHGWASDMFIEDPCNRCVGIAHKRAIPMDEIQHV